MAGRWYRPPFCVGCRRRGLEHGWYGAGHHTIREYMTTSAGQRVMRLRTHHHVKRIEYAWRCEDCGHQIWSLYQ